MPECREYIYLHPVIINTINYPVLFVQTTRPCFLAVMLQLLTLSCTCLGMLFQFLVDFAKFLESIGRFLFKIGNIFLCIRRKNHIVHKRSKNSSLDSPSFWLIPCPLRIACSPRSIFAFSFNSASRAEYSAKNLAKAFFTLCDEELK